MGKRLYREKIMEEISSPEQLNDYIHVANPGVGLVMGAVLILLIGICIWGVYGHLDTTIETVAIAEDHMVTVYIRETDASAVRAGQRTSINGESYELSALSTVPQAADQSYLSEYALHVGTLQQGEWVYTATFPAPLENGVYRAVIVTERVTPISFLLEDSGE